MPKIDIKPISVNACWQGKRFKTKAYKAYETELLYKLPSLSFNDKNIVIDIEFGINGLMDIDNPIKPFLDVLQKKYGFNDRYIHQLRITKVKVKPGKEYIQFKIDNTL